MTGRSWLLYLRPHPSTETPVLLRLFFAAISGAALTLSFTGLFLSIYSWVCLGVLIVMVIGTRPGVAFGCGFLHGVFFVLTSVPWFATVLYVHGGVSRVGGWGVLLLIAMAWGILTGAFTWIVHRLSQRSITVACAGAPFVWVAMEYVRAQLPEVGFPWNLLGYPASSNLALLQLASITGIYGLSFLAASFNALLAWSDVAASPAPRRRLQILGAAAGLVVIVMFGGSRFVPQPFANHFARAVQLNFPETPSYASDWFTENAKDLDEIDRLSLGPSNFKPDLLVWPEAPAPFSYQDPQFTRRAANLATRFGHPFLAGAIEWKPLLDSWRPVSHTGLAPYNSALMFDARGLRTFSYDKIHLVPFGEYEPFPLIHRVVTSLSDEVGGFRRGSNYAVGDLPGGYTFGVFICYEAIFPDEVRRFAANGAQLFINISNDGWFGRSAAPEQHLRMARVRAVENRRWLVRVTNNGYTVSVDPYGHILAPLDPDVRAPADLPYDFRTDKTLYTRFGDWFAWLCVLVSVILLASTFRKAKQLPGAAGAPSSDNA
jgi:apolipoprotein N-acyltransferase